MPAEVIFDRSASREYLQARRWYAVRRGAPGGALSVWVTQAQELCMLSVAGRGLGLLPQSNIRGTPVCFDSMDQGVP